MAKGYTFCHIKSLWKQYSSPILNTSEWCVKFFFFVFFYKFDFDPDPGMDPDPEPNPESEWSEKSDPEPDPEIIFSAPTNCLKNINVVLQLWINCDIVNFEITSFCVILVSLLPNL